MVAVEVDAAFESEVAKEPPKALDGYLVASVPSREGSFRKPADGRPAAAPVAPTDVDMELDGPPSTDDEEEGDVVPELSHLSFANGKKTVREGSFRKRSDEKIARAKAISSSLTSHLVTPAFNARRIAVPEEKPAAPVGSQTATIAPRTLDGKAMQLGEWTRRSGDGGGDGGAGSFKRRATPDVKKKKASLGKLNALATGPR